MPPSRPLPAHASDALMYLGIALMFGSMGPMIGMLQNPAAGWANALVLLVLAGIMSCGWAFMFQRRGWWFLLLIPLLVLPIFGIPALMRLIWNWPVLHAGSGMSEVGRRVTLMVMAMTAISIGFTLIIRYVSAIERAGARAKAELALAAQIHASLVPPLDVTWGRVRILGRSEASGDMGGDLIDAIVTPERVDLFLGDVSGHGVRAGVVMGMLKATLRTALRQAAQRDASQGVGEHLSTLNRVLAELVEPSMFATAVWVRLEPRGESVRASVVVAGHPPVLCRSAGAWREIDGQSLPLGVLADETYVAHAVDLHPGDALVLYSDGLTEATDDRQRQLGVGGLRAIVERVVEDAGEPGSGVLAAVRRGHTSPDDQSIAVVRVGHGPA